MQKSVYLVEQTTPAAPLKKRVAAYARVSSGKDAMLHSLAAQVSYYSEYIQRNAEWEYVGVYADEAMTGTKDSRTEFQRLLADCRSGKIDMVITKSVSRFARNTVTMLSTVRELKTLGVDVFFEKESTHSVSKDGELLLTILASFAQEESRSVSDNCKWRIRKGFEKGQLYSLRFLYGYDCTGEILTIIPEEAEIVRMIFKDYLSGMGKNAIMKKLNAAGIPTKHHKKWCVSSIDCILHNEKYTGNSLLQKTFSSDHISKKKCVNRGELPMYFAKKTHEPIIDQATFDKVQAELERRFRQFKSSHNASKLYIFSGIIRCGNCGKSYRHKVTHAGPVWVCSTFNTYGKATCASKQIPESTLLALAAEILGNEEFDEAAFEKNIDHLEIPCANTVTFVFRDGKRIDATWQDRSRSASWTEEMRAKTAQRVQEHYQRCV